MTAAVSIGELCWPKPTDVALATAAGGSNRGIAVELLQKHDCKRLVSTCSTPEKAEFLHSIGCNEAIHKKPEEGLVADKCRVAPNGFDIVYKSGGGTLQRTILWSA
ncbi:hypothetical protein Q4I30_007071 [Leishmania utingensis]|uniref:Alcohol dehydrogenase-like C-terminal domain-containing protein n=1 Tax=Leishmania utingensis TaxID=653362 RepID=A0AAW3A0L6_9TRYP